MLLKSFTAFTLMTSLGLAQAASLPQNWKQKVQENFIASDSTVIVSDQVKYMIGLELGHYSPKKELNSFLNIEENKNLLSPLSSQVQDDYLNNKVKTHDYFDSAMKNIRSSQSSAQIKKVITGTTKFFLDSTIDALVISSVAASAATGPLPAIMGSIVGSAAKKGTELIYGKVNEGIEGEVQRLITESLALAIKNDPSLVDAQFASIEDMKNSFQLPQKINALLTDTSLTPEQRDAVQQQVNNTFMKKFIAINGEVMSIKSEMRNSLAVINGNIDVLATNVVNNKIQIDQLTQYVEINFAVIAKNQAKFKKSLSSFGKSLVTQHKLIISNSANISLNRLAVIKHEKSIRFLQDTVYSKLGPSQRLALYDEGQYGADWANQGAEGQEKLEILENQAALEASMGKVLDVANIGLQLADSLGINISPDVAKAVNVGNVAYSSAMSIIGGNPMGIINAIIGLGGLFGKKKESPMMQMHKQVMKALNVVNLKLDQILKNQQVIITNQVQIQKMLVQLSGQLADFTLENRKNFAFLRDEVYFNRLGIDDLKTVSFRACHKFLKNRELYLNPTPSLSMEEIKDQYIPAQDYYIVSKASPYKRINIHFSRNSAHYNSCVSELSKIIFDLDSNHNSQKSVNSVFQLNSIAKPSNDSSSTTFQANTTKYIKDFYEVIANYFTQRLHSISLNNELRSSADEVFLSALFPISQVNFIHDSLERFSSIEEGDHPDLPRDASYENIIKTMGFKAQQFSINDFKSLLSVPLNTKRVLLTAKNLIQLHSYFTITEDYFNPSGYSQFKMINFDNLLDGNTGSKQYTGLEMLLAIRQHTFLAIVQENLLSGSTILPMLYEDIESSSDVRKKDAFKILKLSKVINKNFWNYYLLRRLQANNPHFDPASLQTRDQVVRMYRTTLRNIFPGQLNQNLKENIKSDGNRVQYSCAEPSLHLSNQFESKNAKELVKAMLDTSCSYQYKRSGDKVQINGSICHDKKVKLDHSLIVPSNDFKVFQKQKVCYIEFYSTEDDQGNQELLLRQKLPEISEITTDENRREFNSRIQHTDNMKQLLSTLKVLDLEIAGYNTEGEILFGDSDGTEAAELIHHRARTISLPTGL